jgi:hypothetical protein
MEKKDFSSGTTGIGSERYSVGDVPVSGGGLPGRSASTSGSVVSYGDAVKIDGKMLPFWWAEVREVFVSLSKLWFLGKLRPKVAKLIEMVDAMFLLLGVVFVTGSGGKLIPVSNDGSDYLGSGVSPVAGVLPGNLPGGVVGGVIGEAVPAKLGEPAFEPVKKTVWDIVVKD